MLIKSIIVGLLLAVHCAGHATARVLEPSGNEDATRIAHADSLARGPEMMIANPLLGVGLSNDSPTTSDTGNQLTRRSGDDIVPSVAQQQFVNDYVVVIDCGSSGSRAQIYYWPRATEFSELANKTETLREEGTNQPLSLRIRPGLSSVRDDPEAASDYLVPLMRFASDHVPREQHQVTPVYILGTAGLRSLSMRERMAILEDVKRDLGREFQFEKIYADAISGAEEGFFQWLSINTLARRLGGDFDQAQGLSFYRQAASKRRFGLIEMGGASAQVAFEVTPTMDAQIIKNLYKVPDALSAYQTLRLNMNLAGGGGGGARNVSVFSVSFLGYGSDNARSLASDLLAREAMVRLSHQRLGGYGALLPLIYQPNMTLVAADPCLPNDAEYITLKPASVLYSPNDHKLGYTARPSDQVITVKFVGRNNYKLCRMLMERLITTTMLERTTCLQLDSHNICDAPLIGLNFIPWQQLQFLAIGDLYYTGKMFDTNGRLSGLHTLVGAGRVCSMSMDQLEWRYPTHDNEVNQLRNKLACFKATWISVWLSMVLRMPLTESFDLEATDRVLGQDIDWKLGAVIAKTIGFTGTPTAR